MGQISSGAGYAHNNYISSAKVRNAFRGLPYELSLKTVNINGQKRGCSGFIKNLDTGNYCYITTEPFFDRSSGSGLFGNKNQAVMMRTAKNNKDYSGGANHWLSADRIVAIAKVLTKEGYCNEKDY